MYRVLLVDDEALIREAVSENICWGELGYELAASCENGREAMEFIRRSKVDLVLTDICMPYMDGLGLCECLFHEYPQIEIVILSGYDDFDYAKRALSYNVNEYLLKPVTASELSEVLLKMKEKLDKQRQREELIGRMSSAYHKSRMLVRSSALLGVLKGSRTEEENRRELLEAAISLDADYYCVAVLEACLREEQQKESSLMTFVISNVAGEIVAGHGAGEICRDTDLRTLILFKTNKPREFRSIMLHLIGEIKETLLKLMGLTVTAGIGRYVQELSSVRLSLRDAEEALSYQYIFGDGGIIDLEKIREDSREWSTREQDIGDLMQEIKKNDTARIRDSALSIGEHMKEAAFSRNRACLALQEIVSKTGGLLKSFNLEDTQLYRDAEEVLNEVAGASSMPQAMELLCRYCLEAAASMDERKNTGGRKYAMLATDFIETNYGDCHMNLNSVCSYLNISTSRFSSIFKSATGETFMEAVVRIRMQKAKELLENTDLKGYEIAERVGFSDPHYFSAVFKKMTGKTPTEYAKEKRQAI